FLEIDIDAGGLVSRAWSHCTSSRAKMMRGRSFAAGAGCWRRGSKFPGAAPKNSAARQGPTPPVSHFSLLTSPFFLPAPQRQRPSAPRLLPAGIHSQSLAVADDFKIT